MARTSKLASLAALLRIHHWVKNLLVLVPLVTSHEIDSLSLIGLGAIAFLVFSLAASASYVINDLHDIKADRQHPTKRLRPLVTGEIATSTGYVLSTLLVLISVSVASWTLRHYSWLRYWSMWLHRHLFPLHSTNPLPRCDLSHR